MSKKEILEIRVTFKEEQRKLYDYIKNHSSYAGFLKDLAYREMLRDEAYINNSISNNTNAYNYSPVNHQVNPSVNNYPYPISYTIPQNIDPNLYNQNTNVVSDKDNANNDEDNKKKKSRKVKVNVSDLGF